MRSCRPSRSSVPQSRSVPLFTPPLLFLSTHDANESDFAGIDASGDAFVLHCCDEEDAPVNPPETNYTKTADGTHIAYQVVGDGPLDIVLVLSSYVSNVELLWDWPLARSLMTGLAARGRLIIFDRRGTGLSTR